MSRAGRINLAAALRATSKPEPAPHWINSAIVGGTALIVLIIVEVFK